jgi:hypothetical protein
MDASLAKKKLMRMMMIIHQPQENKTFACRKEGYLFIYLNVESLYIFQLSPPYVFARARTNPYHFPVLNNYEPPQHN